MRYFLVTFNLQDKPSIGSISLESERFPSHKLVEWTVSKEIGHEVKICVHTFFEFKTKEDYLDYVKE